MALSFGGFERECTRVIVLIKVFNDFMALNPLAP